MVIIHQAKFHWATCVQILSALHSDFPGPTQEEACIPHCNSRIPRQLEKNNVAPPSSKYEAPVSYSVSREVPCSVLKCETVLGTLDATPKFPWHPGLTRGEHGGSQHRFHLGGCGRVSSQQSLTLLSHLLVQGSCWPRHIFLNLLGMHLNFSPWTKHIISTPVESISLWTIGVLTLFLFESGAILQP